MNWVLEIIADNVFGYLLDHSGAGEKLRTTLKGDPIKTAFQRALETAFAQFERRYPHWASALFDQHFFEHAGAAILAQFLLRDGQPDAQALVDCWIASMGVTNPQTRATRSQDLLPAAQDFLTIFEHALKAEPVLRDIANDRAVEQSVSGITAIARDLGVIRERIERPQSRPDPRIPYLHWLIERNLYLDARGTYQTQRQVQVKLAEVYISLRAVRDDTVNQADRYLLEQEMTALQTRLAEGTYSAEVVEDLYEQVQAQGRAISDLFLEKARALNEPTKPLQPNMAFRCVTRGLLLLGAHKPTARDARDLRWYDRRAPATKMGMFLARLCQYAYPSTCGHDGDGIIQGESPGHARSF